MDPSDAPRSPAATTASSRDPGVNRSIIGALAVAAACVVALGIGVVARHNAEASEFKGSEKIEVHERSFGISVEQTTIEPGPVGFDVHNDAKSPHEFVVFRTPLRADQLPRGSDGDVVEDAPQIASVADSGSSIASGARRAVFANLKPGHYAVVCNLPGHYGLGMHIDLTVTAEAR